MVRKEGRKVYFSTTQQRLWRQKRKDETLKKPEISQDYNNFIQGVDRADWILHYCPCCTKTVKWTMKSVLLLPCMAVLNGVILSKNTPHTKIKNTKAMLSRTPYLTVFRKWWSQKGEKTRMTLQDESPASTSTAPTHKWLLMKDQAECPRGRLNKHKMVHVCPSEKIMMWCRVGSVHKQRKETCFICSTSSVALYKTVFPWISHKVALLNSYAKIRYDSRYTP